MNKHAVVSGLMGLLVFASTGVAFAQGGTSTSDNSAPKVSSVSLSINGSTAPITVIGGSALNIAWVGNRVKSCSRTGAWSGAKNIGTKGVETVAAPSPAGAASYAYQIVCLTDAGTFITATVQVSVEPLPAPTSSLLANGAELINVAPGESFTLTWNSTNADRCYKYGNWGAGEPVSLSGSEVLKAFFPTVSTGYLYEIVCYQGDSQMTQAGVQVNVFP